MMLLAQGQENAIGAALNIALGAYYLAHAVLLFIAFARRKPGLRPLAILAALVAIGELANCGMQRRGLFEDRLSSLWYQWTAAPAILLLLAIWAQIRPSRVAPPAAIDPPQ